MSDQPLSPGQALGRWLLQTIIFIAAGGVAAGLSAVAYEAVAQAQNPVGIYGVVFAGGGLIAYQLTKRVLNAPAE
jgi:hypothetical protein